MPRVYDVSIRDRDGVVHKCYQHPLKPYLFIAKCGRTLTIENFSMQTAQTNWRAEIVSDEMTCDECAYFISRKNNPKKEAYIL